MTGAWPETKRRPRRPGPRVIETPLPSLMELLTAVLSGGCTCKHFCHDSSQCSLLARFRPGPCVDITCIGRHGRVYAALVERTRRKARTQQGKSTERWGRERGILLRRRLLDPNRVWDLVSRRRWEPEGIDSDSLDPGVFFLQPRRHVQNTGPRKQPSDRQHCIGTGKVWDKGKESGAYG